MHTLRKWIRIIFGFSRTETNGFLLLLPLIVLVLISEPIYSWWASRSDTDLLATDRHQVLDSLVAHWEDSVAAHRSADTAQLTRASKLFSFDPNTASASDLVALGFPEKVAAHVIAYRAKGGKFRVRADLKKIYGLDPAFYSRLERHIRLPDSLRRQTFTPFPKTWPDKPAAPAAFDLNTADTTQLIAIYGIGSRLSRRIVAYREKLGGFIALGQLQEVYGLDTTTVRRLAQKSHILPGYAPRKLNINLATDRELSSHPYISIVIAKAIVAYRFQHGNFKAVEDICSLQIVKKEDADKIIPYLSVNP